MELTDRGLPRFGELGQTVANMLESPLAVSAQSSPVRYIGFDMQPARIRVRAVGRWSCCLLDFWPLAHIMQQYAAAVIELMSRCTGCKGSRLQCHVRRCVAAVCDQGDAQQPSSAQPRCDRSERHFRSPHASVNAGRWSQQSAGLRRGVHGPRQVSQHSPQPADGVPGRAHLGTRAGPQVRIGAMPQGRAACLGCPLPLYQQLGKATSWIMADYLHCSAEGLHISPQIAVQAACSVAIKGVCFARAALSVRVQARRGPDAGRGDDGDSEQHGGGHGDGQQPAVGPRRGAREPAGVPDHRPSEADGSEVRVPWSFEVVPDACY